MDAATRRWTPNQLIAHNLRAARELRGLTQEQAAAQLELFLGERWSAAVFSAAERGVAGKRIRVFDANDIHAFARAFELPTGFFFLPPDVETSVGLDSATFDPARPTDQIALASRVSPEIRDRIDQLTRALPAEDRAALIRDARRGDPGGLRENELLRAVAERIQAEVDTLSALAEGEQR